MLQPVGLGLILLSLAPVALLALAGLRRARQRRQTSTRRSLRQARQASRASLEAVRAADPASAEERRDAFARLDALVRQHLSDVCWRPRREPDATRNRGGVERASLRGAGGAGVVGPQHLRAGALRAARAATFSIGLAGHARTRRAGPRRRPLSEMRFLHTGLTWWLAAALPAVWLLRWRAHRRLGTASTVPWVFARAHRASLGFAVCPPACCSSG